MICYCIVEDSHCPCNYTSNWQPCAQGYWSRDHVGRLERDSESFGNRDMHLVHYDSTALSSDWYACATAFYYHTRLSVQ